MSEPMTPEEALDLHAHLDGFDYRDLIIIADRALRTLAPMRTEDDYRVVDPEQTGGRYETRRYERHVSEWREVKK